MNSEEEYNKSVSLWVSQQKNLIEILELNINYLEKEIELKKIDLQLQTESLFHEKNFLSNYLARQ